MSPPLIEIPEARRLVAERVVPGGSEPVRVTAALGRTLAEPVTSADDVPGFDNSAMDGYAVLAIDTAGASAESPVTLRVVDESRAGHPAQRPLEPGEAIAISTGAMVPAGADAVVRVEDTDGGESAVAIRSEVASGRDIRRAGDDIRAGDTVLTPGAALGPAEIGVLASVGRAQVTCARRPRVSVLTTGDELQEPGEPLRPGAIRNSNAHSVAALVTRAGAEAVAVELVADTPEATVDAIERALTGDVVVVCGGVSVGEHDHVRPALERLGVEQVFWGVKLRPGKPTYFGVAPSGALVFGLPGNPVSAMVTFGLFVRPAILAMMGARDDPHRATAVLDQEHPGLAARTQLVRCRLELRDDGWHVTPTAPQGSHVLTSMIGADALAVIPPSESPIAPGTRVEIELLR
jgi:molybdopterin molybdotransferase